MKQRITLFSENNPEKKTLIYDNAPQFTSIDYSWFNIKRVNMCTSAPNMNAFTERVIGSIRRDCLDHVVVLNDHHLKRILTSYFNYYHHWRTHLSLGMDSPESRSVQSPVLGKVVQFPEVGGLHHHYERLAA